MCKIEHWPTSQHLACDYLGCFLGHSKPSEYRLSLFQAKLAPWAIWQSDILFWIVNRSNQVRHSISWTVATDTFFPPKLFQLKMLVPKQLNCRERSRKKKRENPVMWMAKVTHTHTRTHANTEPTGVEPGICQEGRWPIRGFHKQEYQYWQFCYSCATRKEQDNEVCNLEI